MLKITELEPKRVFHYFDEISKIPHGSQNMEKISQYCLDFAKNHSLKAVRDEANNVIIYKNASCGYENSEPVILQGHLDMVCQKTDGSDFDFKKDSLRLFTDGDFLRAKDTTLGADNGIAVAFILSILEDNSLNHPPIEAVFTTDEEIGMIGAKALDTSLLKGKRMFNLDAEEPDTLTVSCAGGSDFKIDIPLKRVTKTATKLTLTLKGLKGGHSGVEINSGRENSNKLLARVLNYAKSVCDFDIISLDGGDKGNAIPLLSRAVFAADEPDKLINTLTPYLEEIKKEISQREEGFSYSFEQGKEQEYEVIEKDLLKKIIFLLITSPNGVLKMSAGIEGLVETSLNLGILETKMDKMTLLFSLRSNISSALSALEEQLLTLCECIECEVTADGHYPPWEFYKNSDLQELYKRVYSKKFGIEPQIVAIHAGLECGVFASGIKDLDCISFGPLLLDVHTTNEKMSISSAKDIYELLISLLEECK